MLTVNEQLVMLAISRCGKEAYALSIQEEVKAHGHAFTLGVLYTVNDGAESAGVNNGNNFTVNQAVHAFVDAYNANGGIGGRHIDPVYAELHSARNPTPWGGGSGGLVKHGSTTLGQTIQLGVKQVGGIPPRPRHDRQ